LGELFHLDGHFDPLDVFFIGFPISVRCRPPVKKPCRRSSFGAFFGGCCHARSFLAGIRIRLQHFSSAHGPVFFSVCFFISVLDLLRALSFLGQVRYFFFLTWALPRPPSNSQVDHSPPCSFFLYIAVFLFSVPSFSSYSFFSLLFHIDPAPLVKEEPFLSFFSYIPPRKC